MKVYEIILKPISGFGTPLKGDTIFGHFCWQLVYDMSLCKVPFAEALKTYSKKPFAVFSSAYPRLSFDSEVTYALRSPSLPLNHLFELPDGRRQRLEKRKDYKDRRWIIVSSEKHINSFQKMEFVNDSGLFDKFLAVATPEIRNKLRIAKSGKIVQEFTQTHNTINRMTGTTGEDGFVPFSVDQMVFAPGLELVLFVGIDEDILAPEQLHSGLQRIGESGFGRDASTGLGRFSLGKTNEFNLSTLGSSSPNACYTLGPCVPQKAAFDDAFFLPFTRFGRHGDVLAKSGNPFKSPVVMADEAAIFKPKNAEIFNKPYIGMAVNGLSKAETETVAQGYSLYVPVKMED